MPVMGVTTSVLALVLLAASTLPPVGEPYTVEGRIERIDRGVDAITTWIALQSGDPLAVQASPGSQPPPVGSRIRITGTRRDDLVVTGPDGHTRYFPVVHTSGAWTPINTPARSSGWLAWVLGGALSCGLHDDNRPRSLGSSTTKPCIDRNSAPVL